MSSNRMFWTKLNHDDARMSIEMMDDAEVGRWFRGWLAGAGGKDYPQEKLLAFPLEMRTGFTAGRDSFADAERYSEKQRDRVNKRYHGSSTVVPRNTTEASGSEKSTEALPSNNQHPASTSEKPEASSDHPLNPPRGKRFVPPTEAEWVAYCSETWADWHPECSAESWAYYESKGWRIGSAICKDWKAAARTAHGNARAWGKLQPIGKAPISLPAPRQEAKRQSWMIERDLREAKAELQRVEAERKEAISQRNRFGFGDPAFARYAGEVKAADGKIETARERVAGLETELKGVANG